MERRINNIVDEHLIGFKKDVCNKVMSVVHDNSVCEDIIAYIYDYNKLYTVARRFC